MHILRMCCATLAVGASTVLAGVRPVPGICWQRRSRLLAAIPQGVADGPRTRRKIADFQIQPVGRRARRFRLGSAAARESDLPAAVARLRACARLLGILRFRAGHAQPFRRRLRASAFSIARGVFGPFYFAFAARLRGRGGDRHRRIGFPPICDAARNGWDRCRQESGIIALLIFLADGHLSRARSCRAGNRAGCCGGRTR